MKCGRSVNGIVISLPEEVPEDGLDNVPADKDPEVVGRNVRETNGRSKLADETNAADHEAGQSQALGTSGCLQSFGRNDTLEGSVGEREDHVEKVVESKSSLALGLAD